ncbi:MAG: glutamine--fructose-6-phosphate transaminase (isomerizing) [Pseudomonadota bacterium]
MCGIVGAVAQRDVSRILLIGLQRLEYRGYDSAGLAIVNRDNEITRLRRLGKVKTLEAAHKETPLPGGSGIAHTRWATHGEPSERNAHPHVSQERIAVVHNGIIENHDEIRENLKGQGYHFESDTDTEVIAHLIHRELETTGDFEKAFKQAVNQLEGAYGMVALDKQSPELLMCARSGSPLVIGQGIDEMFVASDQLALLPVTNQFLYLEEGEVAAVDRNSARIFDSAGNAIAREFETSDLRHDSGSKGNYRHYMLKEIYEQPSVISETLEGRISGHQLLDGAWSQVMLEHFTQLKSIQIVACGTSFHAGMVAKYWIESLAKIPCQVEIASEFRYRNPVVIDDTLFITISQSGETADTMAALNLAKTIGYRATLAICNVPGSSLVRESDFTLLTRAGAEIGVASTKAFTTQLVALWLLVVQLMKCKQADTLSEKEAVSALEHLPSKIAEALEIAGEIEELAEDFAEKHHALFLGRGSNYPIAMEGALKLKEISYIHAEAYAAGELKHGPLALIDHEMPVIVVAPNDALLEKIRSNMEEVHARGGQLYVFTDKRVAIKTSENIKVIYLPEIDQHLSPVLYVVAMQLLSYYVAVIKGTDVDQPRNLAKSVTVE